MGYTIAQALDAERGKPEGTMVLVKSGKFWNAYDNSALMYTRHIHEYKPTVRNVKSVGSEVVSIGFTDSSLTFTVGRAKSQGFAVDISESRIDVHGIPEPSCEELVKWVKDIKERQRCDTRDAKACGNAKSDGDEPRLSRALALATDLAYATEVEIAKFHKSYKFSIGKSLSDGVLYIMTATYGMVEEQSFSESSGVLRRVRDVQVMFRLASRLRQVSLGFYGLVSEKLEELKKLLSSESSGHRA